MPEAHLGIVDSHNTRALTRHSARSASGYLAKVVAARLLKEFQSLGLGMSAGYHPLRFAPTTYF